jgi:hypothetical protein
VLTEQNQVNPGRVNIHETEGWLVELDFHFKPANDLGFYTKNYKHDLDLCESMM